MTTNTLPWTEKYRPASVGEIVGQASAIKAILEWAKNFKTGTQGHSEIGAQRAILLTGPVGSGKTTIVRAIAKELDYELVETNASDFRTKDMVEEKIGKACRQQSLLQPKGKIILVDEADGLQGNSDRGGMAAIAKLVDTTCFPMILTATDKWDQKLSTLRKKCKVVDLRKIDMRLATKRLEEIAQKEGVEAEKAVLAEIARRSDGDLRAAINDLELVAGSRKKLTLKDLEDIGDRDRMKNIFDTLFAIYKSKDTELIMKSVWDCDKSPEEIMLWLVETIPKEYEDPQEIAKAFNWISRADVFTGRIPISQSWTLLSYSTEIMALGTALAKKEKYRKFVPYMPPTYLMRMGRTRASRAMRKQVADKIGAQIHCSRKRTLEQLPYFRLIEKKTPLNFGLDEEEKEFLVK